MIASACTPETQVRVLFQRISDRDFEGIKQLKEQGLKELYHARDPDTNNSALHFSSFRNDPELIQFFIDEGIDPNATNNHGVSSLMVAAHHGFVEAAKCLLANRADPNVLDSFGQNVLWYCLGGTKGHEVVAELCLAAGTRLISDRLGKPILVRACEKGEKVLNIIKLLSANGAEPNEQAERSGRTGLIEAARRGALSVVKELLAHGANPTLSDRKQVSAAHEAAHHGHIEVLQLLRSAGADLDTPAHDGNSPLHLAVAARQLDCARYLASRGADPSRKNSTGFTPTSLAKSYGLKAAMKDMKKGSRMYNKLGEKRYLLELYDWLQLNGAKVQLELAGLTQEGSNSMDYETFENLVVQCGVPIPADRLKETFETLDSQKTGAIKVDQFINGSKLVSKTLRNESFFPNASKKKSKKKGRKDVFKVKLPKTVFFGISTKTDAPPSANAADSPYVPKAIKPAEGVLYSTNSEKPTTSFNDDTMWLLDGVRLEKAHLVNLCATGDWETLIRACYAGCDVNQTDSLYKTPLTYAAAAGRWDVVQVLLAFNAKIDLKDQFGWTALHHACRNGHAAITNLLIANGANVNDYTVAGATPLMNAIKSNNIDTVLCCALNGANLRAKTVCGLSVLDHAMKSMNHRICRLIQRLVKSYRGGRYLTKEWAAIPENLTLDWGGENMASFYGKSVKSLLHKENTEEQNFIKALVEKNTALRAVKPKAVNQLRAPSTPDSNKPAKVIPVSIKGVPMKKDLIQGGEATVTGTTDTNEHPPPSFTVVPHVEAPVDTQSPEVDKQRQKALKVFAETWQKFNTTDLEHGSPEAVDVLEKGSGSLTQPETVAQLLKRHVDITRGRDNTFYAPLPFDWQQPDASQLRKYYKTHINHFDVITENESEHKAIRTLAVSVEDTTKNSQKMVVLQQLQRLMESTRGSAPLNNPVVMPEPEEMDEFLDSTKVQKQKSSIMLGQERT